MNAIICIIVSIVLVRKLLLDVKLLRGKRGIAQASWGGHAAPLGMTTQHLGVRLSLLILAGSHLQRASAAVASAREFLICRQTRDEIHTTPTRPYFVL